MPGDIYLSDAMATSAAAVDHHMGALEGEELFKDLKVTLGIAMGTSIVSDPRQEKRLNICLQVGKPTFRCTNELNLLKDSRGVLPIMVYTGRLRQKGVPFSGFRCIKG